MELPNTVNIIVAVTLLFTVILNPIIVLFHELGHGIIGAMLTKQKTSIYVGMLEFPGEIKTFRIGRIEFNLKNNPFSWQSGHCSFHYTNLSKFKYMLIVLAGPFSSLLICLIASYFFFTTSMNSIKVFTGTIFIGSLFQFIIDTIPNKNPISLSDGTTTYNDGQQLKLIIQGEASFSRHIFFGSYLPFYDKNSSYLNLLHIIENDDFLGNIKLLVEISNSKTWEEDSIRLMIDSDWRSQLGPLISYIASKKQIQDFPNYIWYAIRSGSWITPQLMAVLKYIGHDLTTGLSVIWEDGMSIDHANPLKDHVEKGPGDDSSRLGKLFNSAWGLSIETIPGITDEEYKITREKDFDDSNVIASEYFESLKRTFN